VSDGRAHVIGLLRGVRAGLVLLLPAAPLQERWEDALLAVTSADSEGASPEAWLLVQAGPGGAWLDELSFVAGE
jgi:hypothetical protein